MKKFYSHSWFPYISWFISVRGGYFSGYIARAVMILVVLFVTVFAYFRPVKPRTESICLIVSTVLFLLGELTYRCLGMLGQMFGAFIGIPFLLILLGILLGCGMCRSFLSSGVSVFLFR